MKVLVLTGSPHKNGTSSLLVDEFIRGVKESGNEVSRFEITNFPKLAYEAGKSIAM